MSARNVWAIIIAGLACLVAVHACAQSLRDVPWPSEVFNQKPREDNVAGKFDYYTMVMSWSPTHCVTAEEGRDDDQCARLDGLRYGFVLHGLWPQHQKGYPEACRIGRKPFVPNDVINGMLDIMPSRGLVIHEYKLHGTCSGLDPANYYSLSRRLFRSVRIPEKFKNPYETQFMSPGDVEAAFLRENRWLRPDMIAITCGGAGNRLRDVRICMTRDGKGRACGENEDQRKLCRSNQLHVPPVRSTRYDGIMSDKKPMPPQRDRGLPRPQVIESPMRQ
ncbi:ribonuclease T2 [Hyphomicrobium sp. 1Nfss2.1]|uniref:ribonuclease T2 family protein n=1 Tax=Hyphomicrobium sp. 1Nfss2.1 TaxID=3413936 RepID=UPI003C7D6249